MQNTIVVTVANVVDLRDASNPSNRYLVNQLVADNGFPNQQQLVMVSQIETMTIGASPTVDLTGGLLASASALTAPTAAPIVAPFDPNAPYGQLNQSVLLPPGAEAPTAQLILLDPASIVLPNQNDLFVEQNSNFLSDCEAYTANSNSFLIESAVVTTLTQVASAELAGLQFSDVSSDQESDVSSNQDSNDSSYQGSSSSSYQGSSSSSSSQESSQSSSSYYS